MPLNNILMGALRRSGSGVKHRLEDAAQSLKRALLRANLAPRPFKIKVSVTDTCNFHCPTCSKWKGARPREELSAAQGKTVFERLRRLPLMNEVTIGGGEPFARPDVLEILESAKAQGFYTVVISNGSLVTPDTFRVLDRLGVNRHILSLNSLRASAHDQTRLAPGSGGHILELIEAWKSFRRPELAIEA